MRKPPNNQDNNPEVDYYFNQLQNWRKELSLLREIVLSCGLEETCKWAKPVYMFKNRNLIILTPFKNDCAISFFKGALIKDDKNLLQKPGDNTRTSRLVRFTSIREIKASRTDIIRYIEKAIEVEKAGLKIDSLDVAEMKVPDELQSRFHESPEFKSAFDSLTPGRQRAYLQYFSAAKQSTTRLARIERYTRRIMNRKGIHDCVCGLSQKMPMCDGSHKNKGTMTTEPKI